MKRLAALAGTLLALLASSPARAQIPPEAIFALNPIEVVPTEFHRALYAAMEHCTGREGDFDDVHWFVAEALLGLPVESNTRYGGLWVTERGFREIILTRDTWLRIPTIAHEILHDLYEGDAPLDVADRCVPSWSHAERAPHEHEPRRN